MKRDLNVGVTRALEGLATSGPAGALWKTALYGQMARKHSVPPPGTEGDVDAGPPASFQSCGP
jgi:hypothetical protein